jgi:hypothetical protein
MGCRDMDSGTGCLYLESGWYMLSASIRLAPVNSVNTYQYLRFYMGAQDGHYQVVGRMLSIITHFQLVEMFLFTCWLAMPYIFRSIIPMVLP